MNITYAEGANPTDQRSVFEAAMAKKRHPLEQAIPARKLRRIRQADSRATAKKSRRNEFKQRTKAHHAEQSLIGVASVYLDGRGTDAMRRNVTRHVHRLARAHAEQTGQTFEGALKLAEGTLINAKLRGASQRWAEAA